MDDVLRAAWNQILPLADSAGSRRALATERLSIAPVRNAWLCPVTHRVLPRLVLGRTPCGLRGSPPGADVRPDSLRSLLCR